MTDKELLKLIAETGIQAANYECNGACENPTYGPGTPPDGWQEKAEALLATVGYTYRREPLEMSMLKAIEVKEPGRHHLSGLTKGPLDPKDPCVVLVNTDLSPARALCVTLHEIAHVLLGHPSKTWEDNNRKGLLITVNNMLYGLPEVMQDEIAVELAAVTAIRLMGLPVPDISLDGLHQRMGVVRADEWGDKILADALTAAKIIIPAMLGELAEVGGE